MSAGANALAFTPPPWNKWEVMAVVMSGTFMAILDSSIVNIALPHIMTSLGVSLQDVEWVLTAFMLAAATAMPLTGWLGHRVGYGRLYLAALTLFTIGSALCAISWNIDALIAARVIQAFGAGVMQPAGMAMITQVFPPHQRGRAIGIWGIGAMVAPTIGPTAGAYITEYFQWRTIFTVNLPVGLALIIMGLRVFSKGEHLQRPPAFDWPGYLSLAIFLIGLLLGLDKGQDHGWTSSTVVSYFAVAGIAFAFFLTLELTTEHPVVPLRLFRFPDFGLSMIIAVIRAVALFGAIFLLPVFLQNLMGLSAIQNGIILIPGALTIAFFMPIAGRLTDTYGARWPAILGALLTSFSLLLYRHIDPDFSYWNIIVPQFFRGAGIALMMTPVITVAMNAVPMRQTGIASGLLNIGQQAGGSLGIAMLSTILSRRAIFHAEIIGTSPAFTDPRTIAAALPTLAPDQAQAAIFSLAGRAAQVRAFNDVFALAAGITLLAVIPSVFLSSRPPQRASRPAEVE
jgi:EmrB/QacA subfamily drug resistance transporter